MLDDDIAATARPLVVCALTRVINWFLDLSPAFVACTKLFDVDCTAECDSDGAADDPRVTTVLDCATGCDSVADRSVTPVVDCTTECDSDVAAAILRVTTVVLSLLRGDFRTLLAKRSADAGVSLEDEFPPLGSACICKCKYQTDHFQL